MTGTQLKDLWEQWAVEVKTTWTKFIHGPFTKDADGKGAARGDGPEQQGGAMTSEDRSRNRRTE